MKEKIIPIVSVIIGILAFFLTNQYLSSKQREVEDMKAQLYAGARKIEVAGAARDIPEGTVLARDDLRLIEIFESAAPDRVVMKTEGRVILGRKTAFPIRRDKPILWSDIEGGVPSDTGLAPIVKPGMRALSLSIGGAPAVSGMVEPNNRVDVLGTFTFPSKTRTGEMETVTLTVLQDVTVLATGQTLAKDQVMSDRRRRSSSGYNTVTLEVTPREAEVLVFAMSTKGSLTLTLRNPADVTFESELPEINFEHLENKLPELNLLRQKTINLKRNL